MQKACGTGVGSGAIHWPAGTCVEVGDRAIGAIRDPQGVAVHEQPVGTVASRNRLDLTGIDVDPRQIVVATVGDPDNARTRGEGGRQRPDTESWRPLCSSPRRSR